MSAAKPKKAQKQKPINLALQGGGAHGAYAWGVLDYLLEDGRLNVEGICATSAGTMNACAYAYGHHTGGPEKAREMLHRFWYNIHKAGVAYNPARAPSWNSLFPAFKDFAPSNAINFFWFDTLTRMFSPSQFNPFDFNPLRDVLSETIDFDELKKCQCTKLFISTTHVRTGKVRVFNADQMNIDVAMASACLPYLFRAVEIDDEAFWDGGYVGNPALFPLFYETDARDVLIVHINPIEREEVPDTAPEIMNRINEISFNSSLIQEMRAIAFVKKLVERDMLKGEYQDNFKDVLVHSLRADRAMKDLNIGTKFNSDWGFLTELRDKGRAEMKAWLAKHYDDVGQKDSVDLNEEFLYSVTRMFERDGGVKKRVKGL